VINQTSTRSGEPVNSPNLTELFALLQDVKRKPSLSPKWFEMSHETLYAIEANVHLMPRPQPCPTLWGIQIVFNEALPLNEIKPIYE
jgi:hypothetical protein